VRVPYFIMVREQRQKELKVSAKSKPKQAGAAAGMSLDQGLRWDALMQALPQRPGQFQVGAPQPRPAGGAVADEGTDEEGDERQDVVRSVGNRASDIFNTPMDRRGHRSKMGEQHRSLMHATKGVVKQSNDEIKLKDEGFLFVWEKGMLIDTVKLAIFDYVAGLFNFEMLPSAYPSKLKKERLRQAVARGEVEPEVVVQPEAFKGVYSYLESADKIFVKGAKFSRAPLGVVDAPVDGTMTESLPIVAPLVLGCAPPWGVLAAVAPAVAPAAAAPVAAVPAVAAPVAAVPAAAAPAAGGDAMDVENSSAAELKAELERRQADYLVMMAEYQRKAATESAKASLAARGAAACDPVDMAT
jgi:hypothetical protein